MELSFASKISLAIGTEKTLIDELQQQQIPWWGWTWLGEVIEGMGLKPQIQL